MKASYFSVQKSLSSAFSRLQVWFDPAQTGSPYETSHPQQTKMERKQGLYFSKRLSIRM